MAVILKLIFKLIIQNSLGTRYEITLLWMPQYLITLLQVMGLLPHTLNCGLRMRRECRERFPCHRLQRKQLVSDLGIHHGTCVAHVPWCMSGSLTRDGGENVPGIPGAWATGNFTYLIRGPWLGTVNQGWVGARIIVPALATMGLALLTGHCIKSSHGGMTIWWIGWPWRSPYKLFDRSWDLVVFLSLAS